MKTIFPAPLRFAPGEKWAYSNCGYYLPAEITTKVTGRHWTEHLTERIFKPAGMNTTYPTNTKERVSNRARGYADNEKSSVTSLPACRRVG